MTDKDKEERISEIAKLLNKRKTDVLTEFEKVCPTEMSFNRIKKQQHDGFDELLEAIRFHI